MFTDFMAAAVLEFLFKLAKLSGDGTIDQLIADSKGDAADQVGIDVGVDHGFLAQDIMQLLGDGFLRGGVHRLSGGDIHFDPSPVIMDELQKGSFDHLKMGQSLVVIQDKHEPQKQVRDSIRENDFQTRVSCRRLEKR